MSELVLTGYAAPHFGMKRNKGGDWRFRVAELVSQHCTQKYRDPSRRTSNQTKVAAYKRAMVLFTWLRKDLGFTGLANPSTLDERHYKALAVQLREKRTQGKIGAAYAAGLATTARHIARWIGKPELVEVFDEMLGKDVCKRQLVAAKDKSWRAAGIDFEQLIISIAQYCRWVAMVLMAQDSFGLRRMEGLMLQPLRDIELVSAKPTDGPLGTRDQLVVAHIHVTDGTKGKRPRLVQVDDEWGLRTARLLREEILSLRAQTHGVQTYTYLPPPDKTLEQNCETYMTVLKRFGLTKKKLGVTGHGLRAGFACDLLERHGITPTVRGGDGQHQDPDMQVAVYKAVTEAMGHGRISVVGAYAGAISPRAAARQKKKQAAQAQRLAAIHSTDVVHTGEFS